MQESNYLKLVDPNYRLKQSRQYHLHVRITGSSFSYCVFDPSQGKFIALFDARSGGPLRLEAYLEEDDLLKQGFGLTRVMFTSPQFLLVPEALSDESEAAGWFRKAFPQASDVIVQHPLPQLQGRFFSAISQEEFDFLGKHFPKAHLYHEGVPFIAGLQRQYEQKEQSHLCLNVENRYMEVAFLLGGKLQLYNRFEFGNPEQFIYFPLFVCKQLGLEPRDVNVLLSGMIDENAGLYKQLRSYFRHLDFGELPNKFKYSRRLYDIPQHYFYSLINMELCE